MSTPLHVLILEDKLADAEAMLSELRRAGYEPEWRVVGSERGYLAQLSPQLDVILADYSLRQTNALKALRLLKEQGLDIPFIVVTNRLGDEVAVECMKQGTTDYLLKERIALLGHVVRAALEQKRLREEKQRAEAALKVSEDRNEAFLNATPDSIYRVRRDGLILDARPGQTPSDLQGGRVVGKGVDEALPGDVASSFMESVREALRTRSTQTFEYQLSLDGEAHEYEARCAASGDDEAIVIVRDITERKQTERSLRESNRRLDEALAELRRTQAQVIQQQRLHALGQMAAGIAHNVNNALTPILGFADLPLADPRLLDDKERVLTYLRYIKTSAQDAASMVGRLRQFYRPRGRSEELSAVSLNDVVTQAVTLTQPKWKDEAQAQNIGIAVKTDLQGRPVVKGSEADLRELVTTLILNAVEAMPQGGEISVRTRTEDGKAVLEVSDTGVGMSEEVRQRCFEPFFTTRAERGGMGMGLAVAYGIVQRHEGSIEVESQVGKGTAFTIRLPLHTEAAPVESSNGAPKAIEEARSLKVLVVDDEPLVREVLAQYLTADNHSVETASDGNEALSKFARSRYDLVLTDMAMPRLSGDRLATYIKKMAPVPVILLTGFRDSIDASRDKPADVDLVMGKPITLNALREAINKVVR